MMLWEAYGLEMYEQRADEMRRDVARLRLVHELEAAQRAERAAAGSARAASAKPAPVRLPRRALAVAGNGLVHLGHWLEEAAQQPSL